MKYCSSKTITFFNILLFSAIFISPCISQTDPQVDFAPAIHSPQISALAKFTEFPISLYTGQAEVSVPIYNMQVGDISVPISLQYHTGGVRVEDLATWVGMNWSLNAGGQISRQINGLPDFSKDWFYEHPPFAVGETYTYNRPVYKRIGNTYFPGWVDHYESTLSFSKTDNLLNIEDAAQGLLDTEHDFYHYSAGNYSGKFIIDHDNNGHIVTFPKDDIVVSNNFTEKKITTPDGLTYVYGVAETNNQSNWCTGSGVFPANFNGWEPLAWFLTRIESSTTGAYVDFVYESKNLVYDQNGSVTINEDLPYNIPAPVDSECTIKNNIYTHRLVSINSSDGQIVTFNKGAERKDLFGDYLLDNIVVSHTNSSKTKKYNLKHKYQRQSNFYEINDPFFNSLTTHDESTRLFLMGVEEVSENNNVISLAEFTYNLSYGLPSRRSYAQDHFGYYNGKGNSTIVPAAYINGEFYPGADRTASLIHAKQGTLASMKTSTGGIRSYTYGTNRCNSCNTTSTNPPQNAIYITESTNDFTIPSQGNSPVVLEKTFSTTGTSDLIFRYEGREETFYPGSLYGANAEVKLFELNADGSINSLIFNSTSHRENIEFRNDDESFLVINYEDFINYGDYKLQLTIHDLDWWHELYDYDENHEFSLSVRKEAQGESPPSPPGGFEIGGLRIEAMELYDPVTNKTISRSYVYGNGYMNSFSRYYRNAQQYNVNNLGNYIKRSSSPNVPFSKTKSGVVGYSSVTVNELGNGSTVNSYYSPLDHQDKIMNDPFITVLFVQSPGDVVSDYDGEWNYPFALKDEKDWKRGLLKEQIFYKEDGTPIKKIKNKYHFYDDIYHSENGENHAGYDYDKAKAVYGMRVGSEGPLFSNGRLTNIYFYRLISTWYDIDEIIETNYFEDGQELNTTTKYEYSDNQRTVKSTSITNSNGEIIETTNLFPTDFNTPISNLLKLKNLLNKPIESIQEIQKDSESLNASEVHYTFEENNGNIILAEVDQFTRGNSDSRKIDLSYNDFGNTVEIQEENGTPIVYIWGYNQQFPVAKIENIEYSAVENNTILSGYLDQLDNYTSIDDSNRTALKLLNENIRNSLPNDVMISTYTYDPLIGVTSITDPRGYTIYYEYDDFNRLKQVKDAEGNIVSKNEYNYKN